MEKHAIINIRETGKTKRVKIGADSTPGIMDEVIRKWQAILDTAAKIVNVPSGLIMQLNEESIEVFMKSNTEGNPYEVGEEAPLIYGLYCENVIGTQQRLVVPDARKSKVWNNNNPDIDIEMVSYLGFPINWPNGEVFGTICLLDNKENSYNETFSDLLSLAKEQIETDLELSEVHKQLNENNIRLKQLNNTKTKFLSVISHDIRGGIGTISNLLKMTLENYSRYDKDRLHEIIESVSIEAGEAHAMLEDLLSWAKKDLELIKPEVKEFDLIPLIDNLLHHFKLSISTKELNVEKSFNAQETEILGDERMLKVSLRNIISNAIKFTPEGGSIRLQLENSDNQLNLNISDTGIGMDQKTVKNLFRYNENTEKTGTRGESSAGIGLILAKEFLDKNNFPVSVESVSGAGTSFHITFSQS